MTVFFTFFTYKGSFSVSLVACCKVGQYRPFCRLIFLYCIQQLHIYGQQKLYLCSSIVNGHELLCYAHTAGNTHRGTIFFLTYYYYPFLLFLFCLSLLTFRFPLLGCLNTRFTFNYNLMTVEFSLVIPLFVHILERLNDRNVFIALKTLLSTISHARKY